MKENIVPILLISTVITVFSFVGFLLGRGYERYQWHKIIPAAMDNLCEECDNIGYHKGIKDTLKTCDDVLNKED